MNGNKWNISQWLAFGADVIVIICGLWLLSNVLGLPVVNVATTMLIILAVLWSINMANGLTDTGADKPLAARRWAEPKPSRDRSEKETDDLHLLNQLLTPVGIVLFTSSILCYMTSPSTITLATFLIVGSVIVFGLQTIISLRQIIDHKD